MSNRIKSFVLVVIQYITLLYIFLSGPVIPQNPILISIEIIGFSLGLWAVYEMRTSVLKISPEVAKESSLITTGPYSYFRHPMYLSVLLVTIALVLNFPTLPRIVAELVLLINMLAKISYEEKLLTEHFKEYETYKKKTPYRLIPYLY